MSNVDACPHCDSHRISANFGSEMLSDRDAAPYRCRECLTDFEEPHERPPKNNQASQHPIGLAGRLARADPDEVGR